MRQRTRDIENDPTLQQLFLAGRLILGAYYLYSALGHLLGFRMMSEYAGARGVPLPGVAVAVSGLLLALAGLSFLLGWHPRLGVAALALFLVPTTLIMHAFWVETDPAVRQLQLTNFSKNFGLLGSSLLFLAIREPWPYSLASAGAARARPHEPEPAIR